MTLPAFTSLERIHSSEFAPTEFNPTVPRPDGGGRFDSAAGDYAYLYAAADIPTAVEEVLLRDVPLQPGHARQLPRSTLDGRVLSPITTLEEIVLTDLRSAAALAVLGQDEWLVHCESEDYPLTREWAAAIRSWDTEAQGFLWQSRRNLQTPAYVFFDDRLERSVLCERGNGLPIEGGPGRAAIDSALRNAAVTIV
jgi:hypothetical protein